MAGTKKEVVKTTKEETAMANYDYGTDAGAGIDDIDRDDMAVPFIKLLQAINDEVKPVKNGGLKGAEEGMFMNTVDKSLIDGEKGFLFVAGLRRKEVVEYIPRASGGGFVAAHKMDSEIVAEARARAKAEGADYGKLSTIDGNELVETWSLVGTQVDEDLIPVGPSVLPFTSTKIKVIKSFNYRLKSIKNKPPLFGLLLRVKSFLDHNKKGDFQNIILEFANENLPDPSKLTSDSPAYQAAKAIYDAFEAGEARPDYENAGGNETDDEAKADF